MKASNTKPTKKQVQTSIQVMLHYINELWSEYNDGRLDCVIDIVNDTFHTAWKIAYRYKLIECEFLKLYLEFMNSHLEQNGYKERITLW